MDSSNFKPYSCGGENKDESDGVNLTFIQRLFEKYRVRVLKRFSGNDNTS